MFEWINNQGVRSDKGFVVQFTGRFTIEYQEGPHTTVLAVEPGFDPDSGKPVLVVAVPPTLVPWGAPEFASDEGRRKFIENVREALVFQNLNPVFEDK
ncbi:MAG TPA: hypothetical protein VHV55_16440 [Pirellulales bacterium]|nr:hypothetical protein [Pirellulales bacterium]